MLTPHEWLGREFRELLCEIRTRLVRVRIAVTRPSGRSYGEGALRVVRVLDKGDALELLLAYERYRFHRPDRA